MPRSSAPAVAIVNVLLVPLGAATLAAGVVGFSRVSEMRWAFALLAIVGAVIMGGAVQGLFDWGRAVQVDESTRRAMIESVRAKPAASHGLAGPVLAHWSYAPEEWRRYTSRELGYRTREALMMGAATFVLGTIIIGLLEWDLRIATIISGAVGGVIALGRWLVALAAYRRRRAVPTGDVIIGTHAILVNRRYDVVHDHRVRFGGARVLDGERPAILEVQVMVPGKYRRHPEEYRIPIPAGREDEAREVAAELAGAHA